MKLNCDLGEGLDSIDAQVMPHIHMANIACGGHAGDDASMQRSISLALNYGVAIGAHPSYPDRANFGRNTPTQMGDNEIRQSFIDQVTKLQQHCDAQGAKLSYIKPHGALYNDMMRNRDLFVDILQACNAHFLGLPLLIQGTPNPNGYKNLAANEGVHLLFEGFADRAYGDEGFLIDRNIQGAVHTNIDTIVEQAMRFSEQQGVYSCTGQWLPIAVDTLCIHSDTPAMVEALLAISQKLYVDG
ncbi:5-oxoprolinase subunit PxpA [Teredinibacter waterburyi]|uniref:5-oxoprolinase subunit PxpA n=1 Tax=Teredinibacter waterburyi TaxID=1500538 RepID=UPI00165EF03B|nr:5-oxoprolinase subunit PxpA [Teredinibacter waterburyi]